MQLWVKKLSDPPEVREGRERTKSKRNGEIASQFPETPQREHSPLTPWFHISDTDCSFLAPNATEEQTAGVCTHWVCGAFLWQWWETSRDTENIQFTKGTPHCWLDACYQAIRKNMDLQKKARICQDTSENCPVHRIPGVNKRTKQHCKEYYALLNYAAQIIRVACITAQASSRAVLLNHP